MKTFLTLLLILVTGHALSASDLGTVTWQGTMHPKCTLLSISTEGAEILSGNHTFTIPLDKLAADLRLRFATEIARVRKEQAAFNQLSPEQQKAWIARAKAAEAVAERQAIAAQEEGGSLVFNQDAQGTWIVRQLPRGVSHLQSIGGGQ